MESLPATSSTGKSTGRRRRARVVAVVAGLTALSAVGITAPRAGAAIKLCDDGSRPPCIDHDPSTTSTTGPPQPNWSASISVLDQTDHANRPQDALDPSVRGYWSTAGSPHYVTQSGDATWTDPTHTQGSLSFFAPPLPTSPVGFELFELSRDGRLCRSTPVPAVPASGRVAHVLLSPEIFESADDLQAMAEGLKGSISPGDGAEVTIYTASLVPLGNAALSLAFSGHLHVSLTWLPDVDVDFQYAVVLHVAASRNPGDPSEVVTLHADAGQLALSNPSLAAKVLEEVAGDVEPSFRSAVESQAQSKFNSAIATDSRVQWFAALGYTVSVRTVTTTPVPAADAPTAAPGGLSIVPALCKVD